MRHADVCLRRIFLEFYESSIAPDAEDSCYLTFDVVHPMNGWFLLNLRGVSHRTNGSAPLVRVRRQMISTTRTQYTIDLTSPISTPMVAETSPVWFAASTTLIKVRPVADGPSAGATTGRDRIREVKGHGVIAIGATSAAFNSRRASERQIKIEDTSTAMDFSGCDAKQRHRRNSTDLKIERARRVHVWVDVGHGVIAAPDPSPRVYHIIFITTETGEKMGVLVRKLSGGLRPVDKSGLTEIGQPAKIPRLLHLVRARIGALS
jgi:hypothetical protein